MRKNGFTLIELLIVLAIILLLLTIGFRFARTASSGPVEPAAKATESKIVVVSYGDGVYLLEDKSAWGSDDGDFARALAQFTRDHPTVEIVSVAPMQRSGHGSDVYNLLIVTRER